MQKGYDLYPNDNNYNFKYFNTRKVKVLSLPETIQEKIDVSSEGASLETSIFSCIVSGSERTFTFRIRVLLNTLPTLATLV